MFDDLPDCSGVGDLDDAAVVAGIEEWTRAVAMVAAQRLGFVAELFRRRFDSEWETDEDACDAWDSVAAEIGAASGISPGRAAADMKVGAALCSQLPRVAALLRAGRISEAVARAVVARTELVVDRGLLDKIDSEIAEDAALWGALSKKKLDAAIDWVVDTHDPGGVKQSRRSVRDRRVWFGDTKDGVTEFGGWMDALDAAQVQQRVEVMARGVCPGDPRTLEQCRVDALGAWGAGSFHLQCRCGDSRCPAAGDDGRASNVVVYVYAEEASLAAEVDPSFDGGGPRPADGEPADGEPADGQSGVAACAGNGAGAVRDLVPGGQPAAEALAGRPGAGAGVRVRPRGGLLAGVGVVPPALLASKIAAGAKVRYLTVPGEVPEQGYEPLTALARWVRFRDVWCRFPHCDAPAEFCDLDHVVAHRDGGLTHASNLSAKCRKHHLLKTFHPGWSDVQYPDGTVVWTTPSGRTYTTKPGSRLFFPALNSTTATIVAGTPRPNSPDKLRMMPQRQRSRAKQRAYRIAAERKLNDAHVYENNNPPF